MVHARRIALAQSRIDAGRGRSRAPRGAACEQLHRAERGRGNRACNAPRDGRHRPAHRGRARSMPWGMRRGFPETRCLPATRAVRRRAAWLPRRRASRHVLTGARATALLAPNSLHWLLGEHRIAGYFNINSKNTLKTLYFFYFLLDQTSKCEVFFPVLKLSRPWVLGM